MRYLAIISLSFLAGASSCKKGGGNGPDGEPDYLALQSESVAYTEGQQFVEVKYPDDWTITIDFEEDEAQWAEVSPAFGTGPSSIIRLKYYENPLADARTVPVTLHYGQKTQARNLTQAYNPNVGPPKPAENLSPDYNLLNWKELPYLNTTELGDSLEFVCHDNVKIDGKYARNFSLLFNKKQRMAYWVAYPLHSMYRGTFKRDRDPWQYDPYIEGADQTFFQGKVSPYVRGHQLPFADRNLNAPLSDQTFYNTNATMQNGTLNGGSWLSLENMVRKNISANTNDTLYVVTGAILRTITGGEEIVHQDDAKGNPVAVPKYYFKVLMKYKDGAYKAAIGFWYQNVATSGMGPTNFAKPVAEIEELTGFTFFTHVPQPTQDNIKSSYSTSDWSW